MKKNSRIKKNICIDIDGTITDPYFFVPYLNKITGIDLKIEDYISNDWTITYGPEFEEEYKNFDKNYSNLYLEADLLPNSKGVIHMIEKVANVYFVTARDKEIENITKKWLTKNNLDNIELYSLNGNGGKVSMAKKLNCDVFIEDDPQNLENLFMSGCEVIIMDTNYNRNVEEDIRLKIGDERYENEKHRIHRIKDWKGVGDFFETYLKKN